MKISSFAAIARVTAAAAAVTALACTAAGPETDLARIAGWRSDLDHLVAEARRVHAGPSRPAHGPDFTRAAEELARRIPELSDRRVVVEIQGLLALLGDGHSLVYPAPIPRAPFEMLPLDFYLFSDGLFIVDGSGPAADLVGHRIAAFGPVDTEELLQRMEPYVSRDNAMGPKAFAGLYGVLPDFLQAWGATDDPGRVTLTVVDALGNSKEVTLAAGPPHRVRRRLFPPPGAAEPSPLYLAAADQPYRLHPLPERRTVYFQFNQVTDAPGEPITAFAPRLAAALATPGIENLIVDVRHNNGGNNDLLPPLLNVIGGFATRSDANHVYVLTSRSTFSAAQNFVNRIEQRVPRVVFAGEPSMSSPNFTGEDNPVTLPWSGLALSLSNRYWQDGGPGDTRPWIAPAIAVELSSEDWLHNRDPVLEAVWRTIEAL